jgi:DNA polymerase-4
VPPGREAAFLAPLPLRALPGIGPRGEQRLQAAGLVSIGDLARQDDAALMALGMGKVGRDLRERARGVDRRLVVVEASDPVTIGEETTFEHDLLDPLAMAAELAPIAENVFARSERHGFVARTVTTKLRYSDFAIVTRSRTLPAPVASADVLGTLAVELLERALATRRAPVRLLGVYVGKLAREAQLELPLE